MFLSIVFLRPLGLRLDEKFRIFVATPHFDHERESVSEFLLRRRLSISSLREAFGKDFRYLHLLPSAEVILSPGVGMLPELPHLAIPGTDLLPVLFPIGDRIPEDAMREIAVILQKRRLTPLLCHAERAFPFYGERFLELLCRQNIAFLFTPYALTDTALATLLMQALRRGARLFLGSNAHDLEGRPPTLSPCGDVTGTAAYVYRTLRRESDAYFTALVKKKS